MRNLSILHADKIHIVINFVKNSLNYNICKAQSFIVS